GKKAGELPVQRFQESFGDRDKPLLRPVMFVEALVEGEEALQVAPFGIEGGLRMPCRFRHQVDGSEFDQAVFCLLRMRQNVMGWILSQTQRGVSCTYSIMWRGIRHGGYPRSSAYSIPQGRL